MCIRDSHVSVNGRVFQGVEYEQSAIMLLDIRPKLALIPKMISERAGIGFIVGVAKIVAQIVADDAQPHGIAKTGEKVNRGMGQFPDLLNQKFIGFGPGMANHCLLYTSRCV